MARVGVLVLVRAGIIWLDTGGLRLVAVAFSSGRRDNRSYMEPETHYAKSGGLRIAYQVMGEGPDLVMVRG